MATLALAGCSSSEDLSFACKSLPNISHYRYSDGSDIFYQPDKNYRKYRIWSEIPLDPDHDPSDPTDVDLQYSDQSIMFSYYILLDRHMFSTTKWNNKYLSCHRIIKTIYELVARCENSGYKDQVEFTYSKKRGITSIKRICFECDAKDRQVLVSKHGIGKPCN
jgi:hypothetical protein